MSYIIESSKTKYVSSLGIDVTLNIQFEVSSQYHIDENTSDLTFSNFQMSYGTSNGDTISTPWTGLVDGILTVTEADGTEHIIYNEIWDQEIYINKYNCKMELDTFNPVSSVDDGTPWSYTLSGLAHDENGDLIVTFDWEEVTNVTYLRSYGIKVLGTKVLIFERVNNTAYTIEYYQEDSIENIPESQTKYHDINLILSNLIPTKLSETIVDFEVTLDHSKGTYNKTTHEGNTVQVGPAPMPSTKLESTSTIKYIFNHWNTVPDGSGIRFYPGSKFFINSDIILYPQWDKVVIKNPTNLIKPELPDEINNLNLMGYTNFSDSKYPDYYFNYEYYFYEPITIYGVWQSLTNTVRTATLNINNAILEYQKINSFIEPPQKENIMIAGPKEEITVNHYPRDEFKFTAISLPGYEQPVIQATALLKPDTEIASGSTYEMTNHVVITVSASPKQYYLKVKQSTGINLQVEVTNSPKGGQTGDIIPYLDDEYKYYGLMAGDTVKFSYTLENEYQIEDFSINGKQIWSGDTYTLSEQGENINLNALAGKILHITWLPKAVKILNRTYSSFIYINGKFKRVRTFLPTFPLEFYTSDLQGVYTSNNKIFKVYNYYSKRTNAVVGTAIVGISIIGQGG